MLLAGDIGGTKTDLAVFSPERGPREPLARERFASDDYPGLEAPACDFAPLDPRQAGLLRSLQDRFGHVSYERVCSGVGIPNVYDHLRDSGHAPESPEVAARLAGAEDRTPAILQSALDPQRPCPLCA